ncbi:MAG TPA: helix-hairpin-helix domain-containing protein [Oleiagrimonas sp.]|nr:helix-hairpin-helix domain-containing protein [Oleiagrimonas sp.]
MIRKLTALALGLAFCLPVLAATPVNINRASATTIAKSLDGVGMTKAKAIVAYRKAHGPFKSVKALSHVKGIGPTTLAHNHDAIRLSGHPGKSAKHDDGK